MGIELLSMIMPLIFLLVGLFVVICLYSAQKYAYRCYKETVEVKNKLGEIARQNAELVRITKTHLQ